MLKGPKIKLAVDINRIDRYFGLHPDRQEGFDFDLFIDRQQYNDVAEMLMEYGISEESTIQEICFIILWIEGETRAGTGPEGQTGKFYQMRAELDDLKRYLLTHRITSISLRGEYERNKEGEEFTLREEINIDRVCDGLRSTFREEFNQENEKRKTKGLTAWQRRKMSRIRNNLLGYFTSVPKLDELSLEAQSTLIDRLLGQPRG